MHAGLDSTARQGQALRLPAPRVLLMTRFSKPRLILVLPVLLGNTVLILAPRV